MAGGDTVAIFLANNYVNDLSSKVMAYNVFGTNPTWTTTDFNGYYSNVVANSLDNDGTTEIVLGVNDYNVVQETYTSKFYVLNSQNGVIEYQSGTIEGFIIGPFLGDLDGDDVVEILINVYPGDGTSNLRVYSYQGLTVDQNPETLVDFSLAQNYPNPFNSTTSIPLLLPQQSHVEVLVVNVQGQVVEQILDGDLSSGHHQLHWNGRDRSGNAVASGMYFYEVRIGDHRFRKPMVLLK